MVVFCSLLSSKVHEIMTGGIFPLYFLQKYTCACPEHFLVFRTISALLLACFPRRRSGPGDGVLGVIIVAGVLDVIVGADVVLLTECHFAPKAHLQSASLDSGRTCTNQRQLLNHCRGFH